MRGLLADPPLRRRLLWRDPLRSETMISEDRGLLARTYGTLFGIGGLVGLMLLVFGEEDVTQTRLITALAGIALVMGAVCFTGYRRLPVWWFHAATLLGTAAITAAATTATEGIEGVYALFYVWIAIVASLFFTLRAAVAHIAVAVIAFGTVLFLRDVPFASNYVIATLAVLGTSGVIIVLLRGRVEQLAARLAGEAYTDPVTEILNRRGFNQRFEAEVHRSQRSGGALSLIVCDLDRFKRVNDELGHDEGDAALLTAARCIAGSVRSIDIVGRLGGEEFGVVLPSAGPDEALEIAERLRCGVGDGLARNPVPVTASCGVATLGVGCEDRDGLMRAADAALYEAKRRGRNRSAVAGSDG